MFQMISLVLQIVQDLTTAVSQAILWTAHSPSIFSVLPEGNKTVFGTDCTVLVQQAHSQHQSIP